MSYALLQPLCFYEKTLNCEIGEAGGLSVVDFSTSEIAKLVNRPLSIFRAKKRGFVGAGAVGGWVGPFGCRVRAASVAVQ